MIQHSLRICMDRRTLLKTLVTVPALQFLSRFIKTKAFAADAATGQPIRRLRPSDPAWPAPEKWEKLKQEVGGNLIEVENPLAPCQGSPDSDPCQEELINLTNPYYIGDQPGATQSAVGRRVELCPERVCSRCQEYRRRCRCRELCQGE